MTNKSIVAPASVPQEQFLLAEEDIVFYGKIKLPL